MRMPEPTGGFKINSTHSAEGVMTLAAYSYSHLFARNVGYVGRYCSIGAGLKTFANTHPVDRTSTSPVFYQRRKFREWGGDMDRADMLIPFDAEAAKVRIGNDVWIGSSVRIKEGVSQTSWPEGGGGRWRARHPSCTVIVRTPICCGGQWNVGDICAAT